MSIQSKYLYLEQVYPEILQGIGTLIQKGKLSRRFENINLTNEDFQQLEKAKELCELKIVEQWENRSNNDIKGLCSTYFDIASLLINDLDNEYFVFEQIKLIAFGYLGEHWHFVKQYLRSYDFESISVPLAWNKRLLYLSFKALAGMVVKESWHEISRSIELINQLRDEQRNFELSFLNQVNEEGRPYEAAELVSLYHFAKTIDVLGQYFNEGRPLEPETQIHYHLNLSKEFAEKSGNISLILLYQFYEALAVKMIRNTIWYSTRGVNHWVTEFNRFISGKDNKGVFELLYPQRESIRDQQLLNPAHRAIVVNLPTSSGKTMIAEYRILQALNDFKQRGGWVAYIVPTKSLVNQIFIQFNRDLGGIGLRIEKASGAIELDGFEKYLVEEQGNNTSFDVLVTTYEKMNLLLRQGLGTTRDRPLVLTIVDEAHNIELEGRGLCLELLLSTIKNNCEEVNFMLMTPDISNSNEIVEWLAGDRGHVINLQLDWWQPNERVVGAIQVSGRGNNYDFALKTLHTDKGAYIIGDSIPLKNFVNAPIAKSRFYGANGSKKQVAALLSAECLDINHPQIVLARHPNETYDIAEVLYNKSRADFAVDEDVELLKKLIVSELGIDFPLVRYLDRRIAVHSSALPDEIRFLIEDLMISGNKLQALVATTTIAQGINFPVSSVIIGSHYYPGIPSVEMPVRDFWNLAGRVGRAGQQEMGWVGIALKNDADLSTVAEYVARASSELNSQLVSAIINAIRYADKDLNFWLYIDERWSAILQYISHLRKQNEQQSAFIVQLEQTLQSTFGFQQLSDQQKVFFRGKIRDYANTLTLVEARQADATGFSTVSVRQMIGKLANAGLSPNDWNKDQLFSEQNQSMQKLIGIMLDTYEIRNSMQELCEGGQPLDRSSISRMIIDWVNGRDISFIANQYFPNENRQISIQKATKALYKVIAQSATWGFAALQQLPMSGVDWESLSEIDKKRMANLPAYLHYGVNTDSGVLMRKNNVPRSIANQLGELYNTSIKGEIFSQPTSAVSEWIGLQSIEIWNKVLPADSNLNGNEYKRIWMKLNGIV